MISCPKICKHLRKYAFFFSVYASLITSVFAQPEKFETPLMVYGVSPLNAEHLKQRFGDKSVVRLANSDLAVKKELYIATVYDFFIYRENSRGELIEMTGYVSGACDKVLKSYFEALMPIHVGERGRPLPAKVSIFGIKIDIASDGVVPNFGGQMISLEYDKDRSSQACSMSHTFRRKTD